MSISLQWRNASTSFSVLLSITTSPFSASIVPRLTEWNTCSRGNVASFILLTVLISSASHLNTLHLGIALKSQRTDTALTVTRYFANRPVTTLSGQTGVNAFFGQAGLVLGTVRVLETLIWNRHMRTRLLEHFKFVFTLIAFLHRISSPSQWTPTDWSMSDRGALCILSASVVGKDTRILTVSLQTGFISVAVGVMATLALNHYRNRRGSLTLAQKYVSIISSFLPGTQLLKGSPVIPGGQVQVT